MKRKITLLAPATFALLPTAFKIDAAGTLHLYAVYQHLDADVDLIDSKLANVSAPLDNFQLFYTGARLDF